MRKIKLEYEFKQSDKFNMVLITLFDEKIDSVSCITEYYDLKNKSESELYNELLDNLEAEFDDDLAICIEKLVSKIYEEV